MDLAEWTSIPEERQRELPVAERTEGREARLGLSGRVGGVFRDRQTGSSRSSR